MSNVISQLRRTIQEDGFALVDRKMYDALQEQWIRRALGDEVLQQVKDELEATKARAERAERLLELSAQSST